MCVITSMTALTGWAAFTAAMIETAAVSAAVSAGVSAGMGAEGSDIWKAAGIGGAFGLVGGGAGALGAGVGSTMAGGTFGGAFGAGGAGGTAGAAAGSTAGGATGAGSSISAGMAGIAMGGVSGITGGAGYVAQSQAALNNAKDQQAMLNQQARNEEMKASFAQESAEIEKQDNLRKARMLQGKGRAIGAANGVMLEAGREEALVNVWEQDVAMETAYDNAKIQHNTDLEKWGFRTNAQQMRLQGKLAVKAAKRGNRASLWMGLGTTFASGFASGVSVGYQNQVAGIKARFANGMFDPSTNSRQTAVLPTAFA